MKLIDFLNQFSRLLVILVVLIPTAAVVLGPSFNYKLIITVFFYGIIVERIWFSLFTTKEGKSQKNTTSDWSLILVTYTYLIFLCTLFYDFFQDHHQTSWLSSTVGILLMVISYVIRYWSVFHLGDQWASHLELTDNVDRYLIRSGPYAYMRHPIYTAAIVEFIGMQYLFGGMHSLYFLSWIAIPSVIFRSFYEEKVSQIVFGDDYFKYMSETGRFIPTFMKNLNSRENELTKNS